MKDGSFRIQNGPNLYALSYERNGANATTFHLTADTLFNLTGVKLEVAKEGYSEKLAGMWYDDQGNTGRIYWEVDYNGQKVGKMTGKAVGAGYTFTFTRSSK